jgi:hypothetical protein
LSNVTILRKRKPKQVRIAGWLVLRQNEFVSWQREYPNHSKIVPISIFVQQSDLGDLAVAAESQELREVFFLPAFERAGPQPRGPRAKAARAIRRTFVPLAWALRVALKHDPQLADHVRAYARRMGEEQRLLAGGQGQRLHALVAYMMDTRWGHRLDALGIRRPLDEDLDAFSKTYLARSLEPQAESEARGGYLPFVVDQTILFFDHSYYDRLLEAHPMGIEEQ